MIPRFIDFESIFTAFRNETEEGEAHYWIDAMFHLMLHPNDEDERRFQKGIWTWLGWAAIQLAKPSAPSHEKHDKRPCETDFGFRPLPTPAHQESLQPLAERIDPNDLTLYGYSLEGRQDGHFVRMDLMDSIAGSGIRARYLGLLGAVLRTFRIMRPFTASKHACHDLPKGFSPRLAEQMLHYELKLSRLRESALKHRAIFLTYELLPDSKALVSWARENGTRVFHVMHGQRLPTYQITRATDLILLSKIDEPWFRSRVPGDVRIWTIGHPRLERIHKQVAAPPSRTGQLPRITFFSQPSEADYDRKTRLDDWSILGGLRGKAEVRFRPHPREDISMALEDLGRIGCDFVTISSAGLLEDLEWCDAVASSWSTVSMEAAACGRGIFWTCSTPEKYDAPDELRSHGIGVLLQNPAAWLPYLESWRQDGWKSPVVVSRSSLRELGMIGEMDKSWQERLDISSLGNGSQSYPTMLS